MTGLDAVVEHSYSFFFYWGGQKFFKKMVVLKENVVSVDQCFVVGLRHTSGA